MTQRSQPSYIRFQRPSLPDEGRIGRYLDLSREERWFSNGGPCLRLLRDRLAERVGAYCVPVCSGTLGLMAAIASLFEGRRSPGHETGALMPSFTFPATAQAALWAGLQPVLVDIDRDQWHLDASQLEGVLRRGRGDVATVLAVSAFGTPPMAETRVRWERACRSAGVPLVVDSAAAFGAIADDDTPVGTQGDVEVVSFHATKPFAIGEGGAIFTRNKALYQRIELVVNFGLLPDRSVGLAMGLNAKMSELHAATALAVLDEFDSILEARRKAAEAIRARSGPEIEWQEGCERSTWQFVPVACPSQDRRAYAMTSCNEVMEVRTYYEPLHRMEAFREWPTVSGGLAHTEDLSGRLLCLPMANDLTETEINVISTAVQSDPRARDVVARENADLSA